MASSDSFKAGLFGIGLNIEAKLSEQALYVEIKRLNHDFKMEPNCLKPAIRNMEAMLEFHTDFGEMQACSILEKLNEQYPSDLNALANLSYMYKKLGRDSESDICKKKLEVRLGNKLSQAISILGQAHALNYDFEDARIETPTAHLKKTWLQLNFEGRDLSQLDETNESVVEAYMASKPFSKSPYDIQIYSKEIAVERFEQGIRMLQDLNRPPKEIAIWKCNLAIAIGRLDEWKSKRGDSTASRSENCIKELEIYLDVIKVLSPVEDVAEHLKRYLARSYISFVQLYSYRRSSLINPPEKITSQNLNSLWYRAKTIGKNDIIVLEKCGRNELHRKNHSQAIKFYDRSIRLISDKDINWFSYASKSKALLILCKVQRKSKKITKNEISKTLEDAHQCIKMCLPSKCTIVFMTRLAQICFQRAMPDYDTGINFVCQEPGFIQEGLNIILELLSNQDSIDDGKVYAELGKYYPHIGEFRKAIESHKTALELKDWSDKFETRLVFWDLCKCYNAYYMVGYDKNLLCEFRFMLKEAIKRNLPRWISNAIDFMYQYNRKMLTDLAQNMIDWDTRGCEMFISEALSKLDCQNLQKQFDSKLQEMEDQDSDVIGPMEIKKSQSPENTEYDFFVWHSQEDRDWVNSILRPQLEDYEPVKFKGYLPCRDFVPGEKVTDSILKGIGQSRKLLIILTSNYLVGHWLKYSRYPKMMSVIKQRVQDKTIIPIIIEGCSVPSELEALTPISFIKRSDWDQVRMSISVNMDSELRCEERMST